MAFSGVTMNIFDAKLFKYFIFPLMYSGVLKSSFGHNALLSKRIRVEKYWYIYGKVYIGSTIRAVVKHS